MKVGDRVRYNETTLNYVRKCFPNIYQRYLHRTGTIVECLVGEWPKVKWDDERLPMVGFPHSLTTLPAPEAKPI